MYIPFLLADIDTVMMVIVLLDTRLRTPDVALLELDLDRAW